MVITYKYFKVADIKVVSDFVELIRLHITHPLFLLQSTTFGQWFWTEDKHVLFTLSKHFAVHTECGLLNISRMGGRQTK